MAYSSVPIPLPAGSYQLPDPRASYKKLVGCFAEPEDQDASSDDKNGPPLITLRRMDGLTKITGDGTGNPVRGMWEMAGVEYVVIGPTLYSVGVGSLSSPAVGANLNPIGTGIPGNSFIRMSDNGACLVMLVPFTNLCWTYSPGSGGFQQLTASFFLTLGAIDLGFVDSFMVFLSTNGTTFFNDDGRTVSGVGQITFTTAASFSREFGTDQFVGMAIDHREILMFGTRTSEGYVNAGNPTGTPFSSAPDSFMAIGVHPNGSYTVGSQDQSVFFVANDRTVRRRNGQTPTKVSNAGIDQILKQPNALLDSYALTPTIGGHPMYVLTMPAIQRTLAYDCLTSKWFELESIVGNTNLGYWRPLVYHNGLGLQLLGDSQSDSIGYLDATVTTEFGNPMVCAFTTQSVSSNNDRITHRRIELVCTMGGAINQTAIPKVDLLCADDDSGVFISFSDPQNLGGQGQTDNRAYWFNLGQVRSRIYQFRVTDPTELFTYGVFATLEGGKW